MEPLITGIPHLSLLRLQLGALVGARRGGQLVGAALGGRGLGEHVLSALALLQQPATAPDSARLIRIFFKSIPERRAEFRVSAQDRIQSRRAERTC